MTIPKSTPPLIGIYPARMHRMQSMGWNGVKE